MRTNGIVKAHETHCFHNKFQEMWNCVLERCRLKREVPAAEVAGIASWKLSSKLSAKHFREIGCFCLILY